MRNHRRWTLLAAMAFSVLFISDAQATTLTGKVIEINDGDEITIFNLNRPVRIRLLGIDAPEKNQPFGDLARQHLSDLLLGKVVSVEYSGMDRHTIFIGRVMSNGVDISAQMIRDGVAWFAPQGSRLSEADQEIYSQSERAARRERRGLWQMDVPVAPWEFVKAENAQRAQEAAPSKSSNGQVELTEPVFRRPTPELTNLNLRRTSGDSSARPSWFSDGDIPNPTWFADSAPKNTWHRFQPEGATFSALVPADGKEFNFDIPVGNQALSLNTYVGRDGAAMYQVIWVRLPHATENDGQVTQGFLKGYFQAMSMSFEKMGFGSFSCEPSVARNIPAVGYFAREFELKDCLVPGTIRGYSRVADSQRELYFTISLYKQKDDKVLNFFKSFSLR